MIKNGRQVKLQQLKTQLVNVRKKRDNLGLLEQQLVVKIQYLESLNKLQRETKE